MWSWWISGFGVSQLRISIASAIHACKTLLVALCNDLCVLPYVSAIMLIYENQGPSLQWQLKTLLLDTATVCSWREYTWVCWCNLLKGRKTLYSCCWMSPGRPQPQRKLGTGGWRIRVFFFSDFGFTFPHFFLTVPPPTFPFFVKGSKFAPGLIVQCTLLHLQRSMTGRCKFLLCVFFKIEWKDFTMEGLRSVCSLCFWTQISTTEPRTSTQRFTSVFRIEPQTETISVRSHNGYVLSWALLVFFNVALFFQSQCFQ